MKTRNLFIVSMLAGVLAGCGSGDNSAIRALAGAGAQSMPAPTAQPTPLATETPDIAPQTFIQPAAQAQVIEVTRIVPATVEVEVTREVVQMQQIVITPQPTPCDPRTPAPTIALDATDVAAGVILRGQWPCYDPQQLGAEVQP